MSAETTVASLSTAPPPVAKQWSLPAQLHPWGRFQPGTWRELEVVTETFDGEGALFSRSVTSQKEILKSVTDSAYTIDVQATVDVAGKRIEGPWTTLSMQLSTDKVFSIYSTNKNPDQLISLNREMVNCQVWEIRYANESRLLSDRLFFSREIYPYILRRETYEQTENSLVETSAVDTANIVARSVPCLLDGKIIECAEQHTIRRREKGDSQNLVFLSAEVPGGEVSSVTTDFDSSGHRVRWSVQKLTGYGGSLAADEPVAVEPTSSP